MKYIIKWVDRKSGETGYGSVEYSDYDTAKHLADTMNTGSEHNTRYYSVEPVNVE